MTIKLFLKSKFPSQFFIFRFFSISVFWKISFWKGSENEWKVNKQDDVLFKNLIPDIKMRFFFFFFKFVSGLNDVILVQWHFYTTRKKNCFPIGSKLKCHSDQRRRMSAQSNQDKLKFPWCRNEWRRCPGSSLTHGQFKLIDEFFGYWTREWMEFYIMTHFFFSVWSWSGRGFIIF